MYNRKIQWNIKTKCIKLVMLNANLTRHVYIRRRRHMRVSRSAKYFHMRAILSYCTERNKYNNRCIFDIIIIRGLSDESNESIGFTIYIYIAMISWKKNNFTPVSVAFSCHFIVAGVEMQISKMYWDNCSKII